MRIAVLAVGSRGDVQPMLVLALGLQAAGHTVRLATHEAYAPLAREYGLELAVALDDPFTGMNAGVGGA
jgi:sterol 3beta-glucosyltransferase